MLVIYGLGKGKIHIHSLNKLYANHIWICWMSLFSVIYPLLISFSIAYTGSYCYSLFTLSLAAILGALLALYLDTTQHDELKAIETKLERQGSLRDAAEVQKELSGKAYYKNIAVSFFAVFALFCSAIQTGYLVHITVYCEQYLGINAAIGRSLVSTFNFSILLYRVVTTTISTFAGGPWKTSLNSLGFMKTHLVTMSVVFMLATSCWVAIPMSSLSLFIICGTTGFLRGGLFPYLIGLVNEVASYSGTISSFFILCYGIGDISIVALNGELIARHGASVQPVAILVACICCLPLIVLALLFFKRYDVIRTVRIHLTTGQFGSKHGQAFRTGFIKELVFTAWIYPMNTISLMKPVRNA